MVAVGVGDARRIDMVEDAVGTDGVDPQPAAATTAAAMATARRRPTTVFTRLGRIVSP